MNREKMVEVILSFPDCSRPRGAYLSFLGHGRPTSLVSFEQRQRFTIHVTWESGLLLKIEANPSSAFRIFIHKAFFDLVPSILRGFWISEAKRVNKTAVVLSSSILLLFYATAKPDSLALDKEPVEEEDQVEEEEDKVMLEKFHFEGAPI